MILAIRLLTAWKVFGTLPEADSDDDRYFFSLILKYYSELKFDVYSIWTPEEKQYYKRHGLPYELKPGLRHYYDLFLSSLAMVKGKEARELEALVSDYKEVEHWFFVVQTRNHACKYCRSKGRRIIGVQLRGKRLLQTFLRSLCERNTAFARLIQPLHACKRLRLGSFPPSSLGLIVLDRHID